MRLEIEVSFHHIDPPFDSHVSRLHVFCLYMFHVEITRRYKYASLRVVASPTWRDWKGHEGRTAWAREMRTE